MILALLAALAAYVIVLPTPWRGVALLAIVLGEKSWLVLGAALLVILLATRERSASKPKLSS